MSLSKRMLFALVVVVALVAAACGGNDDADSGGSSSGAVTLSIGSSANIGVPSGAARISPVKRSSVRKSQNSTGISCRVKRLRRNWIWSSLKLKSSREWTKVDNGLSFGDEELRLAGSAARLELSGYGVNLWYNRPCPEELGFAS